MYKEFWGCSTRPFDNVPDPGMYFKMHSTAERTVSELLFAIEEGNECLAVVIGEVGLGKTMTLRIVLDELEPEKYRIAFVTNPDLTFPQLLREIIGQLKGESCTIRGKDFLLEEFNRILFETADGGKKVLVFIDEGNVLKGPNLESLRLLTNMQEDTRNLFTVILAGQPKLGRMLENLQRANLFQRIGIYSRLEPLKSVDLVRDYVEHRLERAGCTRTIFTEAAMQAIYHHSDGVPRLINRLCKLCLKAGQTNRLREIDAAVVNSVAERFDPISSDKTRRIPVEAVPPPEFLQPDGYSPSDSPVPHENDQPIIDETALPVLPSPLQTEETRNGEEQGSEASDAIPQESLSAAEETTSSAKPEENEPLIDETALPVLPSLFKSREASHSEEQKNSDAPDATPHESLSAAEEKVVEESAEPSDEFDESEDLCDQLRLKILSRSDTSKEAASFRKQFLKMSGKDSDAL